MGCCVKRLLILFVISGVALAALVAYLKTPGPPLQVEESGYWGPKVITKKTDIPKDDETIYKFNIDFDEKMVSELRADLGRTKWFEPLEQSKFHYGVNLNSFKSVIEYWRTKYDFAAQLKKINAFPHFKTEIEGLGVHFFRSAPKKTDASVKVVPILMVHGWPGSFVEFLKAAPMLSEVKDGVAFDVIVPSLPGYGYSDPSRKQGMDAVVTARMYMKLMKRLGYEKYYVQGGDWGSLVTTAMSTLYPEKIRGLHINVIFIDITKPIAFFKQMLYSWCPDYFGDGTNPPCMAPPFKKQVSGLLRETGYMHIQATKPDTVGFGLLNHPAGLAAYILEKFSSWTVMDYLNLEDGGLTKKFSLDDLLTNVMVYYASNSIISSQRYYKENIGADSVSGVHSRPIDVPVGVAIFPNEISCAPRWVAQESFSNITTFTYQKDGGHFAAFEQPQLLADDVRQFSAQVEKLYPTEWKKSVPFKVAEAKKQLMM